MPVTVQAGFGENGRCAASDRFGQVFLIEKIVTAYHDYTDARVVAVSELAENDFNLNIRRYVGNAPPPGPQDVRTHLHGGVPEAEVRVHAGSFAAYSIEVDSLFSLPNDPVAIAIFRRMAGSQWLLVLSGYAGVLLRVVTAAACCRSGR